MSEISFGVPVVARNGPLGFLAESLHALADRRLVWPVLVLALLLGATGFVLVTRAPGTGAGPDPIFLAAAAGRLVGLLVLAVAILRILGGSPRRPWIPDLALWLYGVTILFGIGLGIGFGRLFGGAGEPLAGALTGISVSLVTAPLAAWFAAIAIERPLAWRAGRWLTGFGTWLGPLLLWSLLVLVPLGQLQVEIDLRLLADGGGPWFWPLLLLGAPLAILLTLFSLALAATAYRHVARA